MAQRSGLVGSPILPNVEMNALTLMDRGPRSPTFNPCLKNPGARSAPAEDPPAMSNLVFLSGDFCSGSTLLFTLFRKAGAYYCLYEPLHEDILEYLIWPLNVYEHHYFVENYHSEYRGF